MVSLSGIRYPGMSCPIEWEVEEAEAEIGDSENAEGAEGEEGGASHNS